MSNTEYDLVRKHLPKGWKLEYRIALVPPDGGSPLIASLEKWKSLGTMAREAEAVADRIARTLEDMRPEEEDKPDEDPSPDACR